jgi:propanol-preferring alcohol dehydrogenase
MRAMVLEAPHESLALRDLPSRPPGSDEVRIEIEACGVCRTDLHVVDGELPHPKLPLVPGHEIVGRVVEAGSSVTGLSVGQRVGVPWLGRTCHSCAYCRMGRENLCDSPGFTGYTLDGGYADECVAAAEYCFPLPEEPRAQDLAPLLCAGLIGYRALRMAADARRLGLYGFGAAAHILAQVARQQGREIYAFTRSVDRPAQEFARGLGAVWVGGSDEASPIKLDAAIIFAPVGALVPAALKAVRKGGVVVCAGIHMSDIPSFPYADLWEERVIRSVANLTRSDGTEFFDLVRTTTIETSVISYPLERANDALGDLRAGNLQGAAVLIP